MFQSTENTEQSLPPSILIVEMTLFRPMSINKTVPSEVPITIKFSKEFLGWSLGGSMVHQARL